MTNRMLGAIELGGTKTRLAVGTHDGQIVKDAVFPTGRPDACFATVRQFFVDNPVSAIGIGAFGPVAVEPTAANYGRIGNTPKAGWSGFHIRDALAPLGVPLAIDTDVNVALLGEARRGAAAGHPVAVYLTVGTGIGGGLIVDGRLVHGLLHPEMGHLQVMRAHGDNFSSLCRFHAHCVEGLASGPAIEARFGQPLNCFAENHISRELVANYLGQLCVAIILITSAEIIVIGGGVSKTDGLHILVEKSIIRLLNGYICEDSNAIARIKAPALGDFSGIIGAFSLVECL